MEWFALLALYLAVVLVRLPRWDVAPFFDEGAFYYFSLHADRHPPNLAEFTGGDWWYVGSDWFWERPLFYAIMAPAAHVSFATYRVFSILTTSLLSVLGPLYLRSMGVRWWLAFSAGVVVAFLDPFFLWGIRVYMDPVMTLAVVAGLWCWQVGRKGAALWVVTASVWIKPTSIIVLGLLAAQDFIVGLRTRETRLWPLELSASQSLSVLLVPLALLPTLRTINSGGYFPGSLVEFPDLKQVTEWMFITVWLVPVLLAGLLLAKSRPLALQALATGSAFLVMHGLYHREVQPWYGFLSAFLTVLAVAVVLEEVFKRAPRWARTVSRAIPITTTVIVAAIFLGLLLLPASPAKAAWLRPLSHEAPPSLFQSIQDEEQRDRDYLEAVSALPPARERSVFLVDIYYSQVFWLLAQGGSYQFTGTWQDWFPEDISYWIRAVEETSDVTLVGKTPHPFSEALRAAYGACNTYENARFVVIAGPQCKDGGERLRAEMDARRPSLS